VAENAIQPPFKPNPFWWMRQVLFLALGCFFVFFGVHLLIAAYGLKDPFSFILTFFASSYIILISATLVIVFFYRMKKALISQNPIKKASPPDSLGNPEASNHPSRSRTP
jgi:hypothetical protein